MNFQEKLFEATADLRSRAGITAKRVQDLKGSIAVLTVAGREFNKVARRHAARFVKQNSAIAAEAGKEISALARSAYVTLANSARPATTKAKVKTRKTATRKRAAKAA